jgi:uncharacterized coiled-coil protein SlyX
MSNKILNTLNIGNNSYEIDDAFARQKIEEMNNTTTEMEDKMEDYQSALIALNGRLNQHGTSIEEITDAIGDMLPTETASGSVASFPDGADNIPLESLVVGINPVQSGEGDPSPTNVRPITGLTGMTVNANGTEIPISWESEAGTIYGGSLDVLTGVLTVDRAFVDLGTLEWGKASAETKYPRFYSNSLKGIIKPTDASDTVTDAICSDYKATDFNTVYRGDTNSVFAVVNVQSGAKGSFSIIDSRFDNADDFKAAMNGVQFCYPLLKPITYQLTPHEAKTLLGQNNIYADTGDTSVEYRADIKAYINRKIAEAISALS